MELGAPRYSTLHLLYLPTHPPTNQPTNQPHTTHAHITAQPNVARDWLYRCLWAFSPNLYAVTIYLPYSIHVHTSLPYYISVHLYLLGCITCQMRVGGEYCECGCGCGCGCGVWALYICVYVSGFYRKTPKDIFVVLSSCIAIFLVTYPFFNRGTGNSHRQSVPSCLCLTYSTLDTYSIHTSVPSFFFLCYDLLFLSNESGTFVGLSFSCFPSERQTD